jgi:hypothetical protein
MLRFPFILSLSFAALMLATCDKAEEQRKRIAAEYQKRLPEMLKKGIVAPAWEKTFEENQGVKLQLPMPEPEFIALVKKLHLDVYDEGEDVIPGPHWQPHAIDTSQTRHAYIISGKADPKLPFHEQYRAWVDKRGRVVYIENEFGYEDVNLNRR